MMFSSVPSTSTTLLSVVSGVWAQTGSAVVPIMAAAKTRAKIRLSFFIFSSLEYSQKNVFAAVYPNFKFYMKQRGNTMPDAPTSCTEKVFRLYIF